MRALAALRCVLCCWLTVDCGAALLSAEAPSRPNVRQAPPDSRADTAADTRVDPPLVAGEVAGPPVLSVEALTERARPSLTVISYSGRDGKQQGLGSGFIVASDGLIATNYHVIGEARPIRVQLADGREFDVTEVSASDRQLDLALVRIDARDLPALELGDSDQLKQGQAVVALGNPHGLKHSVVTGVVSGTRDIDGRTFIQLAIPIEPGNSGGPLLDLQGRVQGILTMKSAVTDNLGFAVSINQLRPLLKQPHPVSMSRWLTIGALDPRHWTPTMGGRWRQRAGRISVEGLGKGFGGRAICLWNDDPPEAPWELGAWVKLDHEEGAAGLVFCSDGQDSHYGFYPSAGKLRLTRFEGPDVFSWHVLQERSSPHYRPGEWNWLKVHMEADHFICTVNDEVVFESRDQALRPGKVGLAKFRNTAAEFKGFRVARNLPAVKLSEELMLRVVDAAQGWTDQQIETAPLADAVLEDSSHSVEALRLRAKQLEAQAARFRRLASLVHEQAVQRELAREMARDDSQVDLLLAALLVAQLDNDELDIEHYRAEVERLSGQMTERLPANPTPEDKLATLNNVLFVELGFHGSRNDYYHKSNSYINEVLDDREGLPITLALLYMELGRRQGLNLQGVALPGHFVVRYVPASGASRLIDVFDAGAVLSREAADQLVRQSTGKPLLEEQLTPASKRDIIVRMLHNLVGMSQRGQDARAMSRYLDAIVAVAPDSGEDRWIRAVLRFQAGRRDAALQDADWLLDHAPAGVDLNRVTELKQVLENPTR